MRSYDILKADFENGEQLSLNAGCVLAFVRYANPVTFSREKSESHWKTATKANDTRPLLVVVEDIASVQVSATKSNHVPTMNVNLHPGANYLVDVLPGDHVLCWMVQDAAKLTSLVERLKSGKSCNEFDDGLKFVGRVAAVRKNFAISPDGTKRSSYQINAAGFTELDASIYFEPHLAIKQVGIASDWLHRYGIDLASLIQKNGQGIAINSIVPELLRVFFGTGIPKNASIDTALPVTEGLDTPYAFIVPQDVGKIFGVPNGSKPHGLVAYTDLLEVVHGVQKYFTDFSESNTTEVNRGWIFNPDASSLKVRFTGVDQLGTFVPSPPALQGQKTVWSILQQFLNPTVNEMYTTLRVNPNGKVFPTMVVRQLPFSTGLASSEFTPKTPPAPPRKSEGKRDEDGLKLDIVTFELQRTPEFSMAGPLGRTSQYGVSSTDPTRPTKFPIAMTFFTEIPRWVISPVLMRSFNIGRSDALRFNFIHVQGETGQKGGFNQTGAFVRDPPIVDDLDVARSGLRPYMRTVPCAAQDVVNHGAGAWMHLLSDFLMGQQFTLTGQMELVGIQSPIAVGDNVQFDDTILHIEGVTHSFSSDGMGNRKFSTSLSLTHGMSSETPSSDFDIYSGLEDGSLEQLDPSITKG